MLISKHIISAERLPLTELRTNGLVNNQPNGECYICLAALSLLLSIILNTNRSTHNNFPIPKVEKVPFNAFFRLICTRNSQFTLAKHTHRAIEEVHGIRPL